MHTGTSFKVIGHRGTSPGIDPEGNRENTISSFRKAFDIGVFEIECDLAITKDNLIVIYHSKYILSGLLPKKISLLNYKNLIKQANYVPKFPEVLKVFSRKRFLFELKEYTDYKKIIQIISSEYSKEFKFRFISFSIDILKYAKKMIPNSYCSYIATSISKGRTPYVTQKDIQLCLDNTIDEISGFWLTFSTKMIEKSRNKGLEVCLGFIDTKRSLNYCSDRNVKRIVTNKPGYIIKLIRGNTSIN